MLKSIHSKKTWVMVLAFDNFKVYLLNTQKPVIVFTDARPSWVVAGTDGMVKKLAKIQLEIPMWFTLFLLR